MPSLKDLAAAFSTRDFIAVMLTAALIALTFLLAVRAPESDVFKMLVGAMLSTGFASAIGWYFNSSKSSDKKDEIIAAAVPPQPPPPSPEAAPPAKV